MSLNRELVIFYINYKLSQSNYSLNHFGLTERPNRTGGGEGGPDNEPRLNTHPNGTVNGTSPGTPLASLLQQEPQQQQRIPSPANLDLVKETLRDSANKFELRFARTFGDLPNHLHIAPDTAHQSFKSVMDEVFRDGVNWGCIVGLFALAGALCVECVEKEMSPLVDRIVEWMSVYLDDHIQEWIDSHGGWEQFAEIYGQDPTAESKRSQERFKKWLLAGMTLATSVVVGSFIAQKFL